MAQSAQLRVIKNVNAINELIEELQARVKEYQTTPNPNYGHVGDLHWIRGCLHNALGHEDNPDPE